MHRFKNILVGVDLEADSRTLSGKLSPQNDEAIDRGIDLAARNRAQLCFVSVLDPGHSTGRLVDDSKSGHANVFDEAHMLLDAIVSRSEQRGIETESRVLLGKGWWRMIQDVLLYQHDLVIVGTRREGFLDRLLYGSTAMKLLRKCPCPVWITKPSGGVPMTSVLVAHDLGAVGRYALDLGIMLSREYDLQLHVLHAVEHLPKGDPTGFGIHDDVTAQLHDQARDRILTELGTVKLNRSPQVRVVSGSPEPAILETVQERSIDLVVMGTIGRSGLSGSLTGNTAERLLPRLQCSLLALKPDGFLCPIRIEA